MITKDSVLTSREFVLAFIVSILVILMMEISRKNRQAVARESAFYDEYSRQWIYSEDPDAGMPWFTYLSIMSLVTWVLYVVLSRTGVCRRQSHIYMNKKTPSVVSGGSAEMKDVYARDSIVPETGINAPAPAPVPAADQPRPLHDSVSANNSSSNADSHGAHTRAHTCFEDVLSYINTDSPKF